MRVALLSILLSGICSSQGIARVRRDAKSGLCKDIVALAGKVNLNCSGLTLAQRKLIDSIPNVLNKMLANQIDADMVMSKLDEIPKSVNPNLPAVSPKIPAKTYFCNGEWRIAEAGANTRLPLQKGGDDKSFQRMLELYNAGGHAELLTKCRDQISSVPDWLTPYLFCSLAYLANEDRTRAKEMLDYFDQKKGPAYEVGTCVLISNFLHQKLDP